MNSSSSSSGSTHRPHNATLTVPPILRLPPELLDHLLEQVEPHILQSTALALTRVFPDHPISKRHLWRHVVVGRPRQLIPMWRKMKAMKGVQGEAGPSAVRTFAMESWHGDADILNNVLRCLPSLRIIMLNMGANFAPEHLGEMFEAPRMDVQRMEMRFRPYVEQASYYQFLKGSYFDTAIEMLYRRWPEVPSFTHLSIVQDPPPRKQDYRSIAPTPLHGSEATTAMNSSIHSVVNSGENSLANSVADLTIDSDSSSHRSEDTTPATSAEESIEKVDRGYTGHGPFPYLSERLSGGRPENFAQPIVFFDIKCIGRFGASPVAANLTHFRIRVPSRALSHVLIGPRCFPALRYLDISTTNLRLDSSFSALIKSFARLEHLVLDRVNLFGFQAKDKGAEMCRTLGGMILSAYLQKGKERERQIAAWEVAERTRIAAEIARLRSAPQRPRQSQESDGDGDLSDAEEDPSSTTRRAAVTEAEREARREAEAAAAERQRLLDIARSRRGHRSAAHSTFTLRDRSVRDRRGAGPTLDVPLVLPPQDRLDLVLPPLPTLKTICIGGEAHGIPSKQIIAWEDEFHSGWRDGLTKIAGWAAHVADRYERAIKKAEEWRIQEIQGPAVSKPKGGKGKALPQPVRTRPPLQIRLFRYPTVAEGDPRLQPSAMDPTADLIEIQPDSPRDFLQPYQDLITAAELYANDRSRVPSCIICTVPDCDGPARKGEEPGQRLDGRGGTNGRHKPGCGHEIGRRIWGWNGIAAEVK